jgi:hypothetical protein
MYVVEMTMKDHYISLRTLPDILRLYPFIVSPVEEMVSRLSTEGADERRLL